MDAASLFEAFRSVGLLAVFLTNAVMMDDPPSCPLQCEALCAACKAEGRTNPAISADSIVAMAECQEHLDACSTCPGAVTDASNGLKTEVAGAGCRGCVQSVAVTVADAEGCADCCDEASCCPSRCGPVVSISPRNCAVVRVVAHASSTGTCPVSDAAPSDPAPSECSGAKASGNETACSSCTSTRVVQCGSKSATTARCSGGCESDELCPSECSACPNAALEVIGHDDVRGAAVLGQWVADWITGKPNFSAAFTVHGVVPEMSWAPVSACGHKKICAGDRCYEVEEEAVEGHTCDESEVSDDALQQPIHVVPVAPPLPPSYQFTQMQQGGLPMPAGAAPWGIPVSVREADPIESALSETTVRVPAHVLTQLLVERATASTRLEMTQNLMEEREAFMAQYMQVVERNWTLQTQLAAVEARQQVADALAATLADRMDAALRVAQRSSETGQRESSTGEQRSEIDTIQEDLTNIRRQIALLKQPPVPFAPSYVGAEASVGAVPSRGVKNPVSVRGTKGGVYVPVTPAAPPCASEACADSQSHAIDVR